MPPPIDLCALADRILVRLDESRGFYLHTQQAWRVVQQIAHEGHAVGIVDTPSGQEVPAPDLEPLAQRYVTVHLAESAFRDLSGFLEDWIMGLARLWLTAYPLQLDAASNESAGRSRAQRREEIQVPLSEILAAPDRDAILGGVVERVVRELAYPRPAQWFRFLDNRVNLGCPDEPHPPGPLRTEGGPRCPGTQSGIGRPRLHREGRCLGTLHRGRDRRDRRAIPAGVLHAASGSRRGDGRGGDPSIIPPVALLISTGLPRDPDQDNWGGPPTCPARQ